MELIVRERPTAPIDHKLLFVVVSLALFGLVLVYASTYHLGSAYLKWQFIRAGIGLAALFAGIKFDHTVFGGRTGRLVILLVSLAALAATVACGQLVGVTRRILGAVQTSEFAKYALVIWLSGYFADLRDSGDALGFVNSFLKPAAVTASFVILTLAPPAVGTAAIMAASAAAVFFVAGVRKRYLFIGVLGSVLLLGGGLALMSRYDSGLLSRFDYVFR
ncbi:MAG: FtsW/RodA/SpoVE family cell cycle protein, partial [candidate division WOR-3 bacterium]